ncbi:tail fiber assembly protein [Escherichia albertii]|uniref:tail fiber assembly protein n=1 Tax=Escherichia albertii TaxID=208962 RepID=UPI000CF74014|nr:tail fiber assembly protein [Escherichia albertii]EFB5187747.1 tail fiber assembly protein [Escherichia albertii]EJI9010411.1 tail fiber assembly protein [Escherichia albertii]EJQ6148802.1 tail fiber assembly protein [Escherichia albertii]MCZ9131600.1 tail fiber assembly protein [Escherichia albertii]
MLHLKNIRAGNPRTPEQYELTRRYGVEWLYTESGENWYEIQKSFSPDTLKVEYLDTGEVTWVGKDIASVNPGGRNVIEIVNNTANRRIDASGYWFYRDEKFVFDYGKKAEDERVRKLKDVSRLTAEWEKDLLLGLISDEDKEKLKAYRIYARRLQEMELSVITDKASYNSIEWPEQPQNA